MRLVSFDARNFISFPSVSLTFDTGLTLVHGFNHDRHTANGAGKSVLFNAIAFAIYGRMVTGVNLADVIPSWGGPVNTNIELDVPAGRLRIMRSREPNTVRILVDGVQFQGQSAKVEERIVSLCGLTFEQFLQVCYFQQNATDRFADVNDTAKKSFLASVLGLDRCETAYKTAHAEVVKAESAVAREEGRVSSLAAFRDAARVALVSATQRWNAWRDGMEAAEAAIRFRQQLMTLPDHTSDAQLLREEITALKAAIAMAPPIPSAELNSQVTLGRVATITLATTRAELAAAGRKGQELHDRLLTNNCDACGQQLPPDATTAPQIATNDALIESLRAKALAAEAVVQLADDAARRLREIEQLAATHQQNITQLTQKTKELDYALSLQAQRDQLLAERDQAAEREVAALAARERDLHQVTQDAIGWDADAFEKHHLAELDLAQKQLDLAYAQEVKRAFSPTGLRAHVVDAVVQDLNERTAHYVNALHGDGVQFHYELDEAGKLVGRLLYAGQERSSIATLSGGEKQRIRLAVDLALADVVSSKLAVKPNILVLDEVTTGLDAVGREALMNLLQELERGRDAIYVIDHDAEFASRFQHSIRVELRGGKATVAAV